MRPRSFAKFHKDYSRAQADMDLRVSASACLLRWNNSKRTDGMDLAELLEMPDYKAITENMTPEIRRKLEMLISPHGYAIYKAMLARKDR